MIDRFDDHRHPWPPMPRKRVAEG